MANTLNLGTNGNWATKKDSLLAYNSENGNFKPLPFHLSRASSATVVNKDGLIETVGSGEPRIDYKDDSKGALLLEPSRSNRFYYSEDFSNSIWVKQNVNLTSNYELSPSGFLNADRVITTNTGVDLYQNISVSANTTYTLTFYAKLRDGENIQARFYDLSNSSNISYVNYSSQLSNNEWKRVEIEVTTPLGCTSLRVWIVALTSTLIDVSYWGMQLEVGSYATSYIPTQGGVVTRNQDSCSQTVPSGIIGQTEGSIYCEVNISNTSGKSLIALDTGSASNFIVLSTSSSLSPQIQIRQSSGSYPSIISGTTMNYGVNKIAFCYKSGDYAMYINGVLSGTSTSTTFPSGVISQISVGASSSYGYLSDTVNDVKIYNTRLSNAELQALTTL